jgi:hypothetical protein
MRNPGNKNNSPGTFSPFSRDDFHLLLPEYANDGGKILG